MKLTFISVPTRGNLTALLAENEVTDVIPVLVVKEHGLPKSSKGSSAFPPEYIGLIAGKKFHFKQKFLIIY